MRLLRSSSFAVLLLSSGFVFSVCAETNADADLTENSKTESSKFRSPEDGALDLSAFIDQAYGFVPLVIPITEPAIGYGAGFGLIFIDKPDEADAGFARPNISAVGGMLTENGTKGAFGGDSRYWLNGRVQTLVGGGSASINLKYYGIGDDSVLGANPLRYSLSPIGGIVQVKARLKQSKYWTGLAYTFAKTEVEFTAPPSTPSLPSFQRDTRTASLSPSLSYDSRDNVFTPTRGLYVEASAGIFLEALGGDSDFQTATGIAIYYVPMPEKWSLGLRGDVGLSSEDTPFYLRPSISLRGVPRMSMQGEKTAQAEVEVRWQFSGRYSVIAFSGVGTASSDSVLGQRESSVITYGTGFRYEIARKYGLHMGIDLAFGPADPAIYIQFGSAWMRP